MEGFKTLMQPFRDVDTGQYIGSSRGNHLTTRDDKKPYGRTRAGLLKNSESHLSDFLG